TAFLERTQRVTVGGMVVPAIGIRRHPIDVALDFASLARLHPGRVALCVGTGEAMNEQTTTGLWPPLRERMERTTEAIELIRKAWTADDYFHWKGKHFTSFFYLYDKPEQPIPIYCAGNGPKMAYNAGYYADGHVAVGHRGQHLHRPRRDRNDASARRRHPDRRDATGDNGAVRATGHRLPGETHRR
ncbi:hypothetical protein LCGC14_2538060, partial [marine sediment metagenome]